MTDDQEDTAYQLLRRFYPLDEAHHGDCVGADERFHGLAFEVGGVGCRRVGHPPSDESLRAFCECDESREPKPYLERNRDIVDETDVLIAAPKQAEMPFSVRGQGTWSTVLYAVKQGKPVYVVLPDGTIKSENVEETTDAARPEPRKGRVGAY
jgi:hypothetical protein